MLVNDKLSYIEISKENLIHNFKEFRGLVGHETKIACVIKANAYGHGDEIFTKILDKYTDYFQVNGIEEFERVRKFTKKPILILGYLNADGIKRALNNGGIISAFDLIHLLKINKISKNLKKKAIVNLAIDSYLGREGIMSDQCEKITREIQKMQNIKIDGIYSHFSNIEDTMNRTHSEKQIETYHTCVEIFRRNGFPDIKTHISATSGILTYESNTGNIGPTYVKHRSDLCGKSEHNIVRLGIGLYGMWPSEHLCFLNKKHITLKPVMKWITHIAQVKVLPANFPVGYGLTYITKKKTTIAVIPQGYFDGVVRSLSNKGEVLIKGKRAKIIGRVAMNMFVVDITNIKDVMPDDEVVILGKQDKKEITPEEIAAWSDTINYEITTRINALLPRLVK